MTAKLKEGKRIKKKTTQEASATGCGGDLAQRCSGGSDGKCSDSDYVWIVELTRLKEQSWIGEKKSKQQVLVLRNYKNEMRNCNEMR